VPSQKVIKRRLASVRTTRKIMRAMNMVAASKLQNSKNRLEYARSFLNVCEEMVTGVRFSAALKDNPYFATRNTNASAYFVISSNRGMCGSFNSNLLDCVSQHMGENPKNPIIVTLGSKASEYFQRNGKSVYYKFDELLETAFYEDAVQISHYVRNLVTSGMVDEVFVVYTKFESAFVHTPTVMKIMPIDSNHNGNDDIMPMEYDPDVSTFLDHAIPAYLNTLVYLVMLESNASENAARMLNMDSAVNNASDIIDKLTRASNRIRQSAITQEISEIISGWQ